LSETILAKGLTKRFAEVTAVDGLDLSVAEGELFGLVGSDGAGKTTTIRMLTGIMESTSGEVRVLGKNVMEDAEAIRKDVGYMSQRFGLYADLTVQENIDFFADVQGVPRHGRNEKIDRLLAFSNLAPFVKRRAGHLSGGMKQKLGLACALIHTPKVLFLDEPTNGVDPVSRRDFWRILYQLLKEGVTIFVATAYLDEADRCNRVGLIHKGRLVACGTPRELRRLMPAAIVEVLAANPRKALLLLREKLAGDSVGLFGDRLHVVTLDPKSLMARVPSLLREQGLELLGMRQVEPSLEDIFVSMMAEGIGNG
jgi:ABC-2 type transport system ATP-binding protein